MIFDISFVGYFAGICTALAQFPQAYKVYKTKETTSISLGMYCIMTIGIVFWFLYGVLLKDWPMILSNGICLIPSFYTLYITMLNLTSKNKKS